MEIATQEADPDNESMPNPDDYEYAHSILAIVEEEQEPAAYAIYHKGDLFGWTEYRHKYPADSPYTTIPLYTRPVMEGERVPVAIRENYSDRTCSCGGKAWEVETDCVHWTAGDRAAHGYRRATLILNPTEANQ